MTRGTAGVAAFCNGPPGPLELLSQHAQRAQPPRAAQVQHHLAVVLLDPAAALRVGHGERLTRRLCRAQGAGPINDNEKKRAAGDQVIDDLHSLRALYPAAGERALGKQLSALDRHCLAFIALSPFVVLSTPMRRAARTRRHAAARPASSGPTARSGCAFPTRRATTASIP